MGWQKAEEECDEERKEKKVRKTQYNKSRNVYWTVGLQYLQGTDTSIPMCCKCSMTKRNLSDVSLPSCVPPQSSTDKQKKCASQVVL